MNSSCLRHTINNFSVQSDLLLNLSHKKLSNVLTNKNKININAFCNLSLYSIIKIQTSNHNLQNFQNSKLKLKKKKKAYF